MILQDSNTYKILHHDRMYDCSPWVVMTVTTGVVVVAFFCSYDGARKRHFADIRRETYQNQQSVVESVDCKSLQVALIVWWCHNLCVLLAFFVSSLLSWGCEERVCSFCLNNGSWCHGCVFIVNQVFSLTTLPNRISSWLRQWQTRIGFWYSSGAAIPVGSHWRRIGAMKCCNIVCISFVRSNSHVGNFHLITVQSASEWTPCEI